MTNHPIQPDPDHLPPDSTELLLLRWLAGDLTGEEAQRAEQLLKQHPNMMDEMAQYKQLDSLLDQWADVDVTYNREAFAQKVGESIRFSQEDPIDQLLDQWADVDVDMDWDSFRANVMQRVEQSQGRNWSVRWVLGVASPLAAAAVVAIALLWQSPDVVVTAPHGVFTPGPVSIATAPAEADQPKARSHFQVIAIDRPVENDNGSQRSMGMLTIG